MVDAMLRMDEYIDLLVPRGGTSLVRFVAETATNPAVTGGIGVCHTYVDRAADLKMAAESSITPRSDARSSVTHWTQFWFTQRLPLPDSL